jgi:hypothetical protein
MQLRRKIAVARTCIEKHRSVLAEEEEKEWLFVVCASGLPQQV